MTLRLLVFCDAAKEQDAEEGYDTLITVVQYTVAASNIQLMLKFAYLLTYFITENEYQKVQKVCSPVFSAIISRSMTSI